MKRITKHFKDKRPLTMGKRDEFENVWTERKNDKKNLVEVSNI